MVLFPDQPARSQPRPNDRVLRPYQRRIVDEVQQAGNSIVVLPTGAGKTFIAAELIQQFVAKDAAAAAVFFVPTVLLVEQQGDALRSFMARSSSRVHEFRGGQASPPQGFRILVTTPDAFMAAVSAGTLPPFGSPAYGLMVFDEVHHHLKDHPYRKIIDRLRIAGPGSLRLPPHVQLVGLTATLSYKVDEANIKKSIDKLRSEMEIQHIATASVEELQASGYHGNTTVPQIDLFTAAASQTVRLDVVPRADRQPHRMLQTFLDRCRAGTATRAAAQLFEFARCAEREVARFLGVSFVPPNRRDAAVSADVFSDTTYIGVSKWGSEAGKLYDSTRAVTDRTPGATTALLWLMHAYEALRIAVVSWEEQAAEGAVLYLRMSGVGPFSADSPAPTGVSPHLINMVNDLHTEAERFGYPRIRHAKRSLMKAHADFAEPAGPSRFHGILFVEQRVMAHVLAWYLNSYDVESKQLFTTATVHADTPATHLLRLTQAQAQLQLNKFARREANLLVATNAAEEGMDIASANCVLRFDPMHTAVSLVQGRGRAREADSQFVVLNERHDRTVNDLQAAERLQADVVQSLYQPSGSAAAPFAAAANQLDSEVARTAQASREATAVQYLAMDPPTQAINTFCQKAKLTPEWAEETLPGPRFTCTVTLASCHSFGKLSALATAASKRAARDLAAANLVAQLRSVIPK